MKIICKPFIFRFNLGFHYMCQGRSTPYVGDKLISPLIGIVIVGIYKSIRNRVDDHPLLYGNNGSLDPSTYNLIDVYPLCFMSLRFFKHLVQSWVVHPVHVEHQRFRRHR